MVSVLLPNMPLPVAAVPLGDCDLPQARKPQGGGPGPECCFVFLAGGPWVAGLDADDQGLRALAGLALNDTNHLLMSGYAS